MYRHGILFHEDVTAITNPDTDNLTEEYGFADWTPAENANVYFEFSEPVGADRDYLEGDLDQEALEGQIEELYDAIEEGRTEEINLTAEGVPALRLGGGGATIIEGDISELEELTLTDTEGMPDGTHFGRSSGYITAGSDSIHLYDGDKDLGEYTAEEIAGYLTHEKRSHDKEGPFMTPKLTGLLEYLDQETEISVDPAYETLGPEIEGETNGSTEEYHVQFSERDRFAPSLPLAFDIGAGVVEAYESPVSRMMSDATEEQVWANFSEDEVEVGIPIASERLSHISRNAVTSQVENAREDEDSPFNKENVTYTEYPIQLVNDANVCFRAELPAGEEKWIANTFETEPENGSIENIWAYTTSVESIKEAFE